MSRSSQVVTATTRNLLMHQRRHSLDARDGRADSASSTPRRMVRAATAHRTINAAPAPRTQECVPA
ncbi:hypothetical protein [Segeticoccus rhizosphaerae]|uniref:hypothetical protein n=1 Tax=Segeticoccus rhizosphaerae TaxID=1104777 RepID=UPI0010C01D9B|nr:hypothetical protein [Ornithinicoccus soli]